jgi:hypothetical protein
MFKNVNEADVFSTSMLFLRHVLHYILLSFKKFKVTLLSSCIHRIEIVSLSPLPLSYKLQNTHNFEGEIFLTESYVKMSL